MRHARVLLLICTTLPLYLVGCSNAETPRPAQIVTPAPSHVDSATLRMHYNVLPTLAMNESVARSYGVTRDADQALLIVALRELKNGEELPADGTITATVTDLSGRQQRITFRPVQTGAYSDHVGTVLISDHDTLRFVLQADSPLGHTSAKFERNF